LLLSGEKTPAVQELYEGKTRRSFDLCDGLKRARNLAAQMVPVATPEGERHMIYPAEIERVLRMVRKTVRACCPPSMMARSWRTSAGLKFSRTFSPSAERAKVLYGWFLGQFLGRKFWGIN
jgi:hypothetical protein